MRIHPFKDGNDLSARVIFNYLIQNDIACHVSMCSSMKLRNKYIEVLEIRSDSLIKYSNLNNLIDYIYNRIEQTYVTFRSTC